MKLVKMTCPYCGAALEVEEGQKTVVCQYCGQTVQIDEEKNENVVTIKDEAKIKEADLKAKQYEDSKKAEEKKQKKAFIKTKTGKFIIVLIVLDFLGALVAFNDSHISAGIVALLQIALALTALLIGNGSIENIKGKKVPYAIFLVISCILFIPYMRLTNTSSHSSSKEKLVWPSTELASRIPQPDAKYGDVIVSSDKNLDVDVEKFSEKKYQAYVDECKEKGFTVDSDTSTDYYKAADSDGYVLLVMYTGDKMSISLDAPKDYKELTWPVSAVAASLPAPPVNRGAVVKDTSDELQVLIPDIDNDAFSQYTASVLAAGFNNDYKNSETHFEGTNADGIKVTIWKETGNIMDIQVKAGEAPAPIATPEQTAEPTQEATATPTSGIRPEFKEAMDSYKAFFDSYCAFMKSYDASDATMLAKYTQFMSQYADTMEKLDAVDESTLSPEEDDYYLQTMAAINQELLETGQAMN